MGYCSTSYVVFPFRMVIFYLVTTRWNFDISLLCENSINQSINQMHKIQLLLQVVSYLVKVRKHFLGGTPQHRSTARVYKVRGCVYEGEGVRNSTKSSVADRTRAFTRGFTVSTHVQRECSAKPSMRSILCRIFPCLPGSGLPVRLLIAVQIQHSTAHSF